MSDIPDLDERNKVLDNSLNTRPDLSNKFCHHPFDNFEPHEDGAVAVCCLTWLPYLIGNLQHNTMDEIYNSQKAQDIRASILDGSFKYCDHRVCPHIQNNSLLNKDQVQYSRHRDIIDNHKVVMNHPTHINCVYDGSCNLSCPSCRVKKINYTSGEQYETRLMIHDKLMDSLLEKDLVDGCSINITGSGDPFASKNFRDFLLEFDGSQYPNVKIDLQTYGVMFTPKMWRNLHKIHKNIRVVMISFDAALPSTYNITRRDGDWDLLVENVKFLGIKRSEGFMEHLSLDFVVQDINYKEMPQFVALGKSFGGVDNVSFSMVTNWGTWSDEIFDQRAIWRRDHPEFDTFMQILCSEELQDADFVDMSNLHSYLQEATHGKNDP